MSTPRPTSRRPHPAAALLRPHALTAAGQSAALLRDQRPDVVVRELQTLTRDQLVERALAALAMVDVNRPLSELTAWTRRPLPPLRVEEPEQDPYAPWSPDDARRAHCLWNTHRRSTWARFGEQAYQRARHERRRALESVAS